MEALRWVVTRLYEILASCYVAGITLALLIFAMERCGRHREPTQEGVRRAVELYRRYYGPEAERAIGDHMLGASFAPDGRHRQFLERVAAELFGTSVTDDRVTRAIDYLE